jgi:poly(3-hydroxybutyrate) depolymerase
MVHRLAVEDTEQFAAVASVAGFLPESVWNRRPEKLSTAFLQINGTKDDVVPMNANGSAKYNKNPAIEDVLEYYRSANGSADSVKYISVEGGRHSWPEEKFCGFDVDKMILDFFLERK